MAIRQSHGGERGVGQLLLRGAMLIAIGFLSRGSGHDGGPFTLVGGAILATAAAVVAWQAFVPKASQSAGEPTSHEG